MNISELTLEEFADVCRELGNYMDIGILFKMIYEENYI